MKTTASPKAIVRKLRCAVYTRKSSEEGLDMEFNSLDAQREACEAYVASQRSEGWVLVPDRYDDGGISGATLERPALKRLLRDVEAGLVDVVVVYKIDRLSRSLTDFSRLVEVFEANQVTFVSVTQSFNTTTSMGRLTLNILLSFAQFEREVIGERIRDKFAASRRKGMWMGGNVPLGYRVENRKLLIQEEDAATVRMIFERFLSIGSATILARTLNAEGITSRGGRPVDKGYLYKLLSNRVYIGEAVHKGTSYPGEHQAIIIARSLGQGPLDHRRDTGQAGRSLPRADAGIAARPDLRTERLCHDARPHAEEGQALPILRHHQRAEARAGDMQRETPASRRDRGCRRRSGSRNASFAGDDREDVGGSARTWRRRDKRDRGARRAHPVRCSLGGTLPCRAGTYRPVAGRTHRCRCRRHLHSSTHRGHRQRHCRASTEHAEGSLMPDHQISGDGTALTVTIPMAIRMRGGRKVVVSPAGAEPWAPSRPRIDNTLLRAVVQAFHWKQQLESGQFATIIELAEAEKLDRSFVSHTLRLTLIAPDLVEAILDGKQPRTMELQPLMRGLPSEWEGQRRDC